MVNRQDAFFGRRLDVAFLGLPILLILLMALAVQAFNISLTSFTRRQTTSLIIDTFFLGTLHNFLTFWILLKLPRARQWVQDYNKKNVLSFGIRSLILSLLLFFLFGIYHRLFVVESILIYKPIQLTVDILSRVISTHHSLWQIMGISLLLAHNQSSKTAVSTDMEKFSANCRREKLLFKIFFGISAVAVILIESTHVLNWQILLPWLKPISTGATILLVLTVGAIIANQIRNPLGWDFRRTIYVSRLVIWASLLWTPYAYFLAAIIHGVEYGFVCNKMVQNDEVSKKINLFTVLILILSFAVLVRIGRFQGTVMAEQGLDIPIFILVLHSLAYVGQYLHTHIDHLMFSMRNPETRNFSGYLLTKSTE